MAILPEDVTAALLQANVDMTQASKLIKVIENLINNLQETEEVSANISLKSLDATIKNIEKVSETLKTYVDTPEFASTKVIPQTSKILTALEDIQTSIVNVLNPICKNSSSLFTQLQAINTISTEIRKSIYPQLSSNSSTNTVIDDMSLTCLKTYSSFLGIASKVAEKQKFFIDTQINLLKTTKNWLEQYQSELINAGD